MQFRKAIIADATQIINTHVCAYQVSYRGILPNDIINQVQFTEKRLLNTQEAIKTQEYYVIEDNKTILGFLNITPQNNNMLEINRLYVHPDYQQKGVGKKLITELINLKNKEYTTLIAWTLQNGPAVHFYQKMGFIQVENTIKLWKNNIPLVLYTKEIA